MKSNFTITQTIPKEVNPPLKIWKRVWDTLDEISDESGENDWGEGYLLKYEGWGGVCVEKCGRKL